MKQLNALILLFVLGFSAVSDTASADEVVLANGDRITGAVLKLEDGSLVFETNYAGKIVIQLGQVRRMTTDKPVFISFSDGTSREGSAFYQETMIEGESPAKETTPTGIDLAGVTSLYTEPKPPIRFDGRANVGITNEQGNTNTDQYRLDAEFIARTEKQRFTLGGVLNREEANDRTTVANWKAYGLYDYFFQPKWFFNANSLFEHDEFADLDLRTTLGAGVGHQFVESDDLNLSASAGLAYVSEDFIVAEDDDFPAAQWIFNYDQFFFDQFIQLFHSNNGFISLENANKWIINTRQGIRFPLYKGLVTTIQYNYDYQNDPSSEATSRWDSKFMFLLGYQFGN